jgi:PTH1 family peptidyl-tRNA hydrolase
VNLIVGLGNPGEEYRLTPHNLGFMVIDRLARGCGVEVRRPEAQALTAVAEFVGARVVLAKPQTFMNLSGLAVGRLLERYELGPEALLVVVDEIELPFGMLRVRPRGSAGGHNGMKSVIGALGTDAFPRLRLGVRPEYDLEDYASYLLAPLRPRELAAVEEVLEQATDAIRVILSDGVPTAMNRFNRRVKSSDE